MKIVPKLSYYTSTLCIQSSLGKNFRAVQWWMIDRRRTLELELVEESQGHHPRLRLHWTTTLHAIM